MTRSTLLPLLAASALALACAGEGTAPAGPGSIPLTTGSVDVAPAPSLTGTWYLSEQRAAGAERTAVSFRYDFASKSFLGTLTVEGSNAPEALDSIARDETTGALSFHRGPVGAGRWYVGRTAGGVFAGRTGDSAAPASLKGHVTGWSESAFDAALTPRVFDLHLQDGRFATVRIDSENGALSARFKVYATEVLAAGGEQLEVDAEVLGWDGNTLRFAQGSGAAREVFTLRRSGRLLSGLVTVGGQSTSAVTGARSEVLSHGFAALTPARLTAWQSQVRPALQLLLLAGNPAPSTSTVTELRTNLLPTPAEEYPSDRDDDPGHHPQEYTLTELQFDSTLQTGPTGATVKRTAHGYLSTPNGKAPAAGFPLLIALNGHSGSAAAVFDPQDSFYWFGDGWARRGYAVLAIDISHRPTEDRGGRYDYYDDGDSPEAGNGAHPAIAAPGFDSDFEEDGERVWDVLQGLAAMKLRPGIDASHNVITGLSMGAEVSTWLGALSTDVAFVIPAGFSPDQNTVAHHSNHPCWLWTHADLREYQDTSDLHALIAPRHLLLQTGQWDPTYSDLATPFAGDKQVARRSRSAFVAAPGNFVHYLHYDQHHYHFGDVNPTWPADTEVRVPVQIAPSAPFTTDWQADAATVPEGGSLFEFAGALQGLH